MLVPVDEIGRTAEGVGEGAQLGGDFGHQRLRLEPARDRAAHCFGERQKAAVAHRRKAFAHRLERSGQRHMQADRGALVRLIERGKCMRFVWA